MRLNRRLTVATACHGAGSDSRPRLCPDGDGPTKPGDTPLAALLLADGDTFDHNPYDYDILTQAALAVLAAKPDSAVGVLTDGTVPLTAFLPTDRAFKRTVKDLTGHWPRSERRTFKIVAGLGIDTVEAVLLYHVVPGATIDSAAAWRPTGLR